MSKLFTEILVQQNICLFPKIAAKISNVSWLSLSRDNVLPQLTCLPRTAMAGQFLCSTHQSPSHAQGPSLHQKTAQHFLCQHQHWQISASAVCLGTTVAPVRPWQEGQWPWGPPGAGVTNHHTLFLTVLLTAVQVQPSFPYGTAHPLHGRVQAGLPRAGMSPPLPLCGQSSTGDTTCRISLMGSKGSSTGEYFKTTVPGGSNYLLQHCQGRW